MTWCGSSANERARDVARYSHEVIIPGGGSGGLMVAAGCGRLGLKTALIEKDERLGGDCLCYGCVPSKSLLKSAAVYQHAHSAERPGLPAPESAEGVQFPRASNAAVLLPLQGVRS